MACKHYRRRVDSITRARSLHLTRDVGFSSRPRQRSSSTGRSNHSYPRAKRFRERYATDVPRAHRQETTNVFDGKIHGTRVSPFFFFSFLFPLPCSLPVLPRALTNPAASSEGGQRLFKGPQRCNKCLGSRHSRCHVLGCTLSFDDDDSLRTTRCSLLCSRPLPP